MIEFETIILQFGEQGEKTGWRYVEIPADLAQEMKPGNKKAFRVKGKVDSFEISGFALMPMGDGNFIMPLKAEIRKAIHKESGAMVTVQLEEHKDFKVEIPADLQDCFDFDPEALSQFKSLAMSHRNYFIKWIDSAKTDETRAKRIINTVNAMLRKWDYNVMIREMRREND
ncbi:MAG: YdeI/OmpD-associated family protein [Bacteroidota bacterium]